MGKTKKKVSTKQLDTYKIKFHIYGYGKENCVQQLTQEQSDYWKPRFDDEDIDGHGELKEHLWEYDYIEDIPDTHFGKWYDQDDILHMERAYYSDSSFLNISVYKNDEFVEEISLPVTSRKLKKDFYDEFTISKRRNKGESYLYTGSVDRGGYCDGSFTLPEGEVFDIKKISINVGKIMNERFVMTVCYDGEGLEDEGCLDSIGKGFDVDVYFY